MTHAANLPFHQYVSVDKKILSGNKAEGWEEAVWFGLISVPHRAWGCTVMLKCGAIYRGLPISALAHAKVGEDQHWALGEAQRWDCFGYSFSPIRYDYLRELDCSVWIPKRNCWFAGHYVFTAEPYEDGYSLEPSQTKSHHFIALVNGRYACVPGNNIIWKESSFVREGGKPDWLRVQTETWHAEEPGFDRVVTEDSA